MVSIPFERFLAPPLGPEMELLVLCALTQPEPVAISRIRDLVRQGVDWDRLLKLAEQHGTLPLLRVCLKTVDSAEIPLDVWEHLESWFLANATRSLYAASQLVEILGQLEDEGIRALAFKGPVLAQLAFGDVTARHFGDLDLLVAERDYSGCGDFLVSRGFRREQDFNYESSYLNEATNTCIDLHLGIVPSEFCSARLDFDSLWERRASIPVLGARVHALRIEDLVVVLSMQLVRDIWCGRVRISKIADIAQLTQIDEKIDWKVVEKEAAKVGCKRMVVFALRLGAELCPLHQAKNPPRYLLNSRTTTIPLVYVRRHLCSVIGNSLSDNLLRVGLALWTLRRLADTDALRALLGDNTVQLLAAIWRMARMIGSSGIPRKARSAKP